MSKIAARLGQASQSAQGLQVSQVLIVEDDVEGAEAIREYLEFRGLQVDVVASAEAALTAFSSGHSYQVVVTDLHLPGIRGDELASRLLSTCPRPPKIIALSGAHGGQGGDAAPFDLRLPKPCKPRELAEIISGFLKGPVPA